MKTLGFCLLILSLSVLQLKALLDYSNPASTWTGTACTTTSVFQSPANLLSDRCAPYESFSIDLPDIIGTTTDTSATTGSWELLYTTGKLNVDGKEWTTEKVWFRTPAEHHLPHLDMADSIEMQIVLQTAGGDNGVLSFIMFSDAKSTGYAKALPTTPIVGAFAAGGSTTTLNLASLTTTINQKLSNGVYLNMFTYRGTLTDTTCTPATWYIYGTPLVVPATTYTAINTPSKAAVGPVSADGGNNRQIGVANGGKGSLAATRLCYTGYFKNYMNYNYGLWFGVTIIVGWFIVNLMLGEKPVKDSEYQENTWTNHPLYSIYHIGNDLFTRKTRMSLLLGTITIHALFSSVWYRRTSEENRTRGSNIIVYAVYSMLVDWAFIFIIGSMLRGYYIAKHQYYKTKEEAWQQKSQNRLFAFYFCIFLLAAILWPFTVWNMGELHPEKDQKASDYWVASFFVGLALELLIVDPLVCILAKSITPLRNFIKNRGYFYDHICHETYLDHLKVE